MLKRIKEIREEAYNIWDEGLEIASATTTNNIEFIKKREKAQALLRMSEILAEENGIDLNDHYNQYGEWIE
ncbi:MAG: hypothetical protein AWU54_458 [Candidatus Frackibacter sp. T328-2]|nr:MAG: hypothetical protein AWU54_458 [Candidatus Frackibacter sp. T328-2]